MDDIDELYENRKKIGLNDIGINVTVFDRITLSTKQYSKMGKVELDYFEPRHIELDDIKLKKGGTNENKLTHYS